MDLAGLSTEQLLNAYGKRVYNLAYRALMNPSDAQDVVQETFVQVHRGLSRFRGESAPYTWIYRIAMNIIGRYNQSAGREVAELIGEDSPVSHESLPGIVEGLDKAEQEYLFGEVSKEIRERCHSYLTFVLTPEQRSVFLLRELLDLSYRDIGVILDIDENVVRSRLKRARDHLARRLTTQCSWFNPKGTCTCQSKVAYVLRKYPALIAKYTRNIPREHARTLVNGALASSPHSIHEIYRQLPEVEYKIKPLFKESP